MNLGICLAGGGIKGAAHVGVLKALEEENIKFNYIAGTSSGSIVASLYGAGYLAEEIFIIFKEYCKKIKYVDAKNILKGIYGLIFKRQLIIDGLNSGEIIEKNINEACIEKKIKNIKDYKIPILMPSVDIHNGKVYVFSSISPRKKFSDEIQYIEDINIGKAVRASCSYPGVFSPCTYKNRELVDGGLRENVPWKELKEIGAEKILSIVFEEIDDKKCCSNIIEVVTNSIGILCHELSIYELEGADYLLKIKTPKVSLLDTSQIDKLYEIGYQKAKKEMIKIKKELIIK